MVGNTAQQPIVFHRRDGQHLSTSLLCLPELHSAAHGSLRQVTHDDIAVGHQANNLLEGLAHHLGVLAQLPQAHAESRRSRADDVQRLDDLGLGVRPANRGSDAGTEVLRHHISRGIVERTPAAQHHAGDEVPQRAIATWLRARIRRTPLLRCRRLGLVAHPDKAGEAVRPSRPVLVGHAGLEVARGAPGGRQISARVLHLQGQDERTGVGGELPRRPLPAVLAAGVRRAEHVRVDHAGVEGDCEDTSVSQLQCQGLRHRLDRPLCGAVATQPWNHGSAISRGHEHDLGARRPQMRDCMPQHATDADDVHLARSRPILRGRLPDRARRAHHGRIADQQVN
mmetsp:Transcript_3134/g.8996  ORF Transcript_3134/g.8996 Transcript_3134/m.8996 type:complete len:340 (-) Transcript_3134:218-1237(-)